MSEEKPMAFPETKIEVKVVESPLISELLANDPFAFITDADWEQEITEEQEIASAKFDREREGNERRAKRLTNCGKLGYRYQRLTGYPTKLIFRCGLHRECDYCLGLRAYFEKISVLDTTKKKEMVVVRKSKSDTTKMLRGIKKSKFSRFPQEGEDITLIEKSVAIAKGIEGQEAGFDWAMDQNWEEIVKTPEGRSKSGSMNKRQFSKPKKDSVTVNAKLFTTDASPRIVEEVMQSTWRETAHLDPKNAQEWKRDNSLRVGMDVRKLRKMGFTCDVYGKNVGIVEDELNWRNSIGSYTHNPTSKNGIIPEIPPKTQ